MSEKVDTGGSAFACKYGYGFGSVGMTLLDYFAGQIAAGELSHESGGWVDRDDFAHYCYQRARLWFGENENSKGLARNEHRKTGRYLSMRVYYSYFRTNGVRQPQSTAI